MKYKQESEYILLKCMQLNRYLLLGMTANINISLIVSSQEIKRL
jgi:hypothetical protein